MIRESGAQTILQTEIQGDWRKSKVDHLLNREFWDAPLKNFALATGLTISMYDKQGNCLSGPHGESPLSLRFSKEKFWKPGGIGQQNDFAIGKLALVSKQIEYQNANKGFGLAAFAMLIQDQVVGFFTIGWVPDRFVDPITSDYIAKSSNLQPMEVWQLIRMQPPMAKEKILLYASLLKTFSTTFMQQLERQWREQEYNRTLKAINECGASLTVARTIPEIATIAMRSVLEFGSAEEVQISIFSGSDQGEPFVHKHVSPQMGGDLRGILQSNQTVFTVPIQSAGNTVLGTFEVKKLFDSPDENFIERVSALANQVAVAIQKVRLIEDLEREQTLLRNLNFELSQMSKIKDEFLATLSHELRTPMNAILGWSQLLRDREVGPDDLSYAMAAVERNAKIQSHLIEDLLDISRIISGKMILNREHLDLKQVLAAAIETVRPAAEAKKISIGFHSSPEELPFFGDSTRIQQILWNLLSNSVKFTPEGGSVEVLLEKAGDFLKVEVCDSGKGISQEFLPQLFHRFSQADGSSTRLHGGLGLGLAIVRHLIELHGGTIQAFSDGEDKGSRFLILLPQSEAGTQNYPGPMNLPKVAVFSDTDGKLLNGYRILVVDDELDSLRLINYVLEKSGASVRGVLNTQEAFEEFRNWRPDLIISDISMPGENGYEFIKRIRLLSPSDGGATPAIALTALAGSENAKEAFDAGFQKHFAKPLNSESLLEALREIGLTNRQ